MAAAVLSGTDAMAQLSYQNGDMIAAFGKAGSTVDVIVDLGSIAQFQHASGSSINYTNISSALSSVFGGTTGLYWSVFGINDTGVVTYNTSVTQADRNTVWGTIARLNNSVQTDVPDASGVSASQRLALLDIRGIVNLAIGSGTAVSPNIVTVSTATELNGFTPLMVPGGSLQGNLGGDWSYNMLNTGANTSDLYQSDPGTFGTPQTFLGSLALSSAGVLTFNPVPEPSTWAMMAGGCMSLLLFRRRK